MNQIRNIPIVPAVNCHRCAELLIIIVNNHPYCCIMRGDLGNIDTITQYRHLAYLLVLWRQLGSYSVWKLPQNMLCRFAFFQRKAEIWRQNWHRNIVHIAVCRHNLQRNCCWAWLWVFLSSPPVYIFKFSLSLHLISKLVLLTLFSP